MSSQTDLPFPPPSGAEQIAPGVTWLHRFTDTSQLLPLIARITATAPWRHLSTRGGGQMSVAMSNCGHWGWHSDARGYRYVDRDPETGQPWPVMPQRLLKLAASAAEAGGFPGFAPDCCLLNRYVVGAQMGAHRDFDELDMHHPIVSVSIGIPATFLWHGERRGATPQVLQLEDGDVLVWGDGARAGYHAVRKLKPATHPLAGALRYNLTFRRAR